MPDLHEILAQRVATWRGAGYPCGYPAIAEIFEYAIDGEREGQPFPQSGSLRYLRAAQMRALETYWYLRLVEGTPHTSQLYEKLFPDPASQLDALGLSGEVFLREALKGIPSLLERIKRDDSFVLAHDLEALRETLRLPYPSYILALAMGAGKTVLIGAIVATEFAMALDYPWSEGDAGIQFVENALVFAPGKTILESLRELARVPYERILPPRLYKRFAATWKPTFTSDRDRDIPVIRGSSFNLIVTNTEKIRIQARPVRRLGIGALQLSALLEQAQEEANLRLQAISSLPHLAVFSDEAHHTYGQALGTQLKRVRQTVDYLAEHSPNLICVINTTGTPYFERQPLKDVVVWYGLSQGIADGVLKEVAGNIQEWQVDRGLAGDFVAHVVRDFFNAYADVALPDGAPARIAIYFPQTDDLEALRPRVELALGEVGQSTATVLAHTSKTGKDAEDAFNRLANDPRAPHRVVLLVNKGTEGWNCPSLFATALARKLTSSNNFVLQAASRCLRQVPGNDIPARIYLSSDNHAILDRQLRETYGESIADLDRRARETKHDFIRLDPAKQDIPPMILRRTRRVVRRREHENAQMTLTRQTAGGRQALIGTTLEIAQQTALRRILRAVGDELVVEVPITNTDLYSAAVDLAANLHLEPGRVLKALRGAYPDVDELPIAHLPLLASELELQLAEYEVIDVDEEVSLQVVKPEGFVSTRDSNGAIVLEAEISYPADRVGIVFGPQRLAADNPRAYGFHYSPYNFDTQPEVSYFEQVLRVLNRAPSEISDVSFVGALTDPAKTDLTFEYRRADGRPAYYTPDFLLRCKDGRWYLTEIKRAIARSDPVEGEQGSKAAAVRSIIERNGDRLSYEMVFTATDQVTAGDLVRTREFVRSCTLPMAAM